MAHERKYRNGRTSFIHPIRAGARRSSARAGSGAVVAVAAAGLLAACGTSGGGTNTAGSGSGGAQQAVVSTRQLQGAGAVLVDGSGKTIYSPDQEENGKILCTGGCLSFWTPVTASPNAVAREPGQLAGALGTVHRPDDGKTQLTYNHRPLYTFTLDTSPGQLGGNNFKDSFGGKSFTWRAVTAGQPVAVASSTGTAPTPGNQPGY